MTLLVNGKSGIIKKVINADQIRQTITEFPWEKRFANVSVNEQVQLFTQSFQKILSNYIPHETIPMMTEIHHGQMRKSKSWFSIKTVPLMHILEIKIVLIFLINLNLFKHS